MLDEESQITILELYDQGKVSLKDVCERINQHRTTVWRKIKRLREHGREGLKHRLRERPSNRSKPVETRRQVLELWESNYKPQGFRIFQFYQTALKFSDLNVSYTTVRRWLKASGKMTLIAIAVLSTLLTGVSFARAETSECAIDTGELSECVEDYVSEHKEEILEDCKNDRLVMQIFSCDVYNVALGYCRILLAGQRSNCLLQKMGRKTVEAMQEDARTHRMPPENQEYRAVPHLFR